MSSWSTANEDPSGNVTDTCPQPASLNRDDRFPDIVDKLSILNVEHDKCGGVDVIVSNGLSDAGRWI
jgi:hypothetical protein